MEGEGGLGGNSRLAAEQLQGTVNVGGWVGGYRRLEMRLGLALGYGNAFGTQSGPESVGGTLLPSTELVPY